MPSNEFLRYTKINKMGRENFIIMVANTILFTAFYRWLFRYIDSLETEHSHFGKLYWMKYVHIFQIPHIVLGTRLLVVFWGKRTN